MTIAKIEEIRAEELADDIEFEQDLADLCLRDDEAVRAYFNGGGDVSEMPAEDTIGKWLHKNVSNAAHRKKLEAGLKASFSDLHAGYAFVATHVDEDEALGALLSNIDVPKLEHKFMISALTPLWKVGVRPPLATESGAEHAHPQFAAWLRARLRPLGWGAALSWEASHELFVPRNVRTAPCLRPGTQTRRRGLLLVQLHLPIWLITLQER